MKSPKYLVLFALAGGLAFASSAVAQSVTGTPYLSNVDPAFPAPGAKYASWATATMNSTATGLQVISSGWGSGYYVIPGAQVQTINASATHARLAFTVGGNAADYNWVGLLFSLNDDSGGHTYSGLYSGSGNPGNPATVSWVGNTATWTVPLEATQLARVQAGNDHVYSFELGFDPAVLLNGRTSYDVTFNSLEMFVVPEPSTLAILGLGLAALVAARRRS